MDSFDRALHWLAAPEVIIGGGGRDRRDLDGCFQNPIVKENNKAPAQTGANFL